jgi:hypothetical protein
MTTTGSLTLTTAGPDLSISKTEVFDVDMARWILDNKDISKDERDAVRRLYKGRTNGNQHVTHYKLGKDLKHEDVGRFVAMKGAGLQCVSRDCRAALAQRYYYDVDIVNAQPTLLQQYAERKGWVCEALKQYNESREEYLEELMELGLDRWEAKERVIAIVFGGTAEGLSPFFVSKFAPEIRKLLENIYTDNQKTYPSVAKRGVRSLTALVLQTEERRCLMALDLALARQGRSLDVLIHDGGLVRKKDNEQAFPTEVLRKCETAIAEETGYKVRLAVKELKTTLEKETDEDLLPSHVIVDDAYAATTLVNLLGDKIVLDRDVFVFDDATGIWTSDPEVLNRKLAGEFRDALVFRQQGPMGIKVYNYSGDVAHQDRLRRALPAVLPDRQGYFKDRIETSVDKLLFANGIYDFKTGQFTLGFDPAVVFFGAVPRPFPTHRNEPAIEFVRTLFFRDPFKSAAVGDTLLHFLARAVAGHYEAKKVVVAYGPENSSKGSVTKHLMTTLGPTLMASFQGDSLLLRTGDVEATKSLSWVKKFCDKRIAYSSEISVDPNKRKSINGNLLKSLSGGGDEITLRTNHKDEEEVVNKAITFVFVNDLPDISPVDASIRDRLVTIPYAYSFVDEPKLPYQKKRDHTISATLKQDQYRDAMIWLLLDAYRTWDRQPYPLPEECRVLKDDLAPEQNLLELLSEGYDITGDPNDQVESAELVAFLRTRKVDGSDRKISDRLSQVGLETAVRRDGRRTIRVRVGIKPA